MLFDAGEFVLLTEHNVTSKNNPTHGSLILTNKRLAMETSRKVKSGLFGKQNQDIVIFNIPLTNILIADKKKDFIFKKHEFSVNADGKTMVFTVNEPQVWINQIAAAKSGNVGNMQNQSAGVTHNVIIQSPNSSGSRSQPEDAPVQTKEVIKIRCSNCKGLVDETAKFCPSCGNTIQ